MLLDVEDLKCTRLELMFAIRGFLYTNKLDFRILLKSVALLQFSLSILNKCRSNIKRHLEEEFLYVDACRVHLIKKTVGQ